MWRYAMAITTLSSRELNQDIGRAKRAARNGPVIITDRGKPVHVLLSYDEYQRIIGQQENIVDQLGLPSGIEDVEVEFPRSRELARPADFT
ncbi:MULTISPECIES: type II toxin-antitoxin system Phd/YefM family antitoxin [Nitrosomonas]|nr:MULTISPECIES: type II toxin-antitoxin system Phd/YefM family antitoxin [Nitrosomonas]